MAHPKITPHLKFLRKQFEILNAQAPTLSFNITEVSLNKFREYSFSIINVTEEAIRSLKILTPNNSIFNSFIRISNITVVADNNPLFSNQTLTQICNDILTTVNQKKTITTPFSQYFGDDKLDINQIVDKISILYAAQSSLNIRKTYIIEFSASRYSIISSIKSNSKNLKSEVLAQPNIVTEIRTSVLPSIYTVNNVAYPNTAAFYPDIASYRTTQYMGGFSYFFYIWHTNYWSNYFNNHNRTKYRIWQRCYQPWNSGQNGPPDLRGNPQNPNYLNQYNQNAVTYSRLPNNNQNPNPKWNICAGLPNCV
jgi:hypothetical protein